MMNLLPVTGSPINNGVSLYLLIILCLFFEIVNEPVNLVLIFELETVAVPECQQLTLGAPFYQRGLAERFASFKTA